MARTADDIIQVNLKLSGTVSLDWERIEQDPLWKQIGMQCEIEGLTDPNARLYLYLAEHISRDRLLTDMPATNGPGKIFCEQMEVIDVSSNGDALEAPNCSPSTTPA